MRAVGALFGVSCLLLAMFVASVMWYISEEENVDRRPASR